MTTSPTTPADPIDEYDQMAEAFRLRTGLLCPGKSYPPDMDDGATEDHRNDAWRAFRDYYQEARRNQSLQSERDRLQSELTAIRNAIEPAFDPAMSTAQHVGYIYDEKCRAEAERDRLRGQVGELVARLEDADGTLADALNEGGDQADMDDITRAQLSSLLMRVRQALRLASGGGADGA